MEMGMHLHMGLPSPLCMVGFSVREDRHKIVRTSDCSAVNMYFFPGSSTSCSTVLFSRTCSAGTSLQCTASFIDRHLESWLGPDSSHWGMGTEIHIVHRLGDASLK